MAVMIALFCKFGSVYRVFEFAFRWRSSILFGDDGIVEVVGIECMVVVGVSTFK